MKEDPVCIIGSSGNMGSRYTAIMNFLQEDSYGIDLNNYSDIETVKKACNKFIIATPTNMHINIVREIAREGIKILCEKPLSTKMGEVEKILDICERTNSSINMVNNYSYVKFHDEDEFARGDGKTFYNYYKSGSDGLIWDCIQLIGLAKHEITFASHSPIWQCAINGQSVRYDSIDTSYITMMIKFLGNKIKQDNGHLFEIHKKTSEIKNTHRIEI